MQQEPQDWRFGAVVRFYRKKAHLSQKELAEALGYATAEWCSMIESGARSIDLERVPDLARVLRVKAGDLTKLAFAELFPRAADVLFPNTQSRRKIRNATKDDQVIRFLPETVEAAGKFEKLSDIHRGLILELMTALESVRTQSRPVPSTTKDAKGPQDHEGGPTKAPKREASLLQQLTAGYQERE